MSREENLLPAWTEEIQLSLDAIGTIVNTDIPRVAEFLALLEERVREVDDKLKENRMTAVSVEESLHDVDAKLDMLLAKVDLIERRIAEISARDSRTN